MKTGVAVTVYLKESTLRKLDEEVERRAKTDKELGLSGHAVTTRSKLVTNIVTEYFIDQSGTGLSIRKIREIVQPICMKYGVARADLFGSYARGEQTEKSDVDIIIDEGGVRGLGFFRLQDELENALGKRVDLQSLNGSNERFLESIRDDRVMLYVA